MVAGAGAAAGAGIRISLGGSTPANWPGMACRCRALSIEAPRRLAIRTSSCQPAPRAMQRRSGADDASRSAVTGRSRNTGASQPWACTCSRRICSGLAWGSQETMAPAGSALISCSVAQRRSAELAASIQTTWSTERPSWHNPPTCGSLGGATRYRRPRSRVNAGMAGPSRRHSQTAACAVRSSVRLRLGQPPPGNWASRAAKPVGTVAAACPPSSVPRQRASATCAGKGRGSHEWPPTAGCRSDASSRQEGRGMARGKAWADNCIKVQYMAASQGHVRRFLRQPGGCICHPEIDSRRCWRGARCALDGLSRQNPLS